MAFFDEFQHLKIQLEHIKSATDNFGDSSLIGIGGFGKVYKGVIFHSKGRGMAAFKRLDSRYGQGNSEFWKEIMMLSRFTHENLVSLLGFCDEGGEKILVYEYVSRGSLDHHLSATDLKWTQRLKICLAVARGLNYLHDPKGAQQRVLHRDIKSSNILLDENWNAKISDLGLSKIGPANQQYTVLVTNVVGTLGYLDPLYMEMGLLTKESDVYSFGVVLFEILCGKLCYEGNEGRRCDILVRTWKQSYKQKNIDEIIFQDLLHQMDSISLEIFSKIAYQCLHRSREKRPTMAQVVETLESALEFQEIYEQPSICEQPPIYDEVVKAAVHPLIYRSEREMMMFLYRGILVYGGTTWISLNKNEEVCEMISAAECLTDSNAVIPYLFSSKESRFAKGCLAYNGGFGAHAIAQFLSPGITYTINLVFKIKLYTTRKDSSEPTQCVLYYKPEGKTNYSASFLEYEREDVWMKVALHQFTSSTRTFTAKIQFDISCYMDGYLLVEGIEFRPLEKVEKVDMKPLPDSSFEWELKLPEDYKEILKWSKDIIKFATTKELCLHFRKGFLINNVQREEWFYLAKNYKKCHMLPARTVLVETEWRWLPVLESRFEEAAFNPNVRFSITCQINPQMLSPQTTYACCLVYKITENNSNFEDSVEVTDKYFNVDEFHMARIWFIDLLSSQTPVSRLNFDENTHNLADIPKNKGLPLLRNDGWMEVQIWEFQTGATAAIIWMDFYFSRTMCRSLRGLVAQGIEFKPV